MRTRFRGVEGSQATDGYERSGGCDRTDGHERANGDEHTGAYSAEEVLAENCASAGYHQKGCKGPAGFTDGLLLWALPELAADENRNCEFFDASPPYPPIDPGVASDAAAEEGPNEIDIPSIARHRAAGGPFLPLLASFARLAVWPRRAEPGLVGPRQAASVRTGPDAAELDRTGRTNKDEDNHRNNNKVKVNKKTNKHNERR